MSTTTTTTTDDRFAGAQRRGAPPGPAVPATLRHGATLAWRGLVKTVGSPEALLDVTLQPIVFLMLFVYVFGGAIAGDSSTYLQFALPGVLVQTIVFASAGTGTALADDLKTGIFDRFRSLPIPRSAPLLGAIGADLVRYLASGLIMVGLGVVLGFRFGTDPLSVVAGFALVMVFAFALCWVFTALAMVVREPRSVQGIGALIMLPLTFGSNVFVPAETMPSWLQVIVGANPITHLVTAVRGLMHGTVTAGAIGWVLLASGTLVAAFAPLTMYLYRNKK